MKTLGEVNRQGFRAAMDQETDLTKGYQAGAEAVKAEVIERIKRELDSLVIHDIIFDADADVRANGFLSADVIDILNALLEK